MRLYFSLKLWTLLKTGNCYGPIHWFSIWGREGGLYFFFLTEEMCVHYGNKDQIGKFKENKYYRFHQRSVVMANTWNVFHFEISKHLHAYIFFKLGSCGTYYLVTRFFMDKTYTASMSLHFHTRHTLQWPHWISLCRHPIPACLIMQIWPTPYFFCIPLFFFF